MENNYSTQQETKKMTTNLIYKTALALLFFALLTVNTSAQKVAVATATLSKQERAEMVKYLEDTRKKFLASVKGLSDAQLKFKASPERWSIAECSEHIALSEDLIFGNVTERIMKSPAAPEKKELVKGKDEMLRKNITDRSKKGQAPEPLKPSNKWANEGEIIKAFTASRNKTVQYVKTTSDDLRSHFASHPAFKELDGYQWMLLLSGHSERHTLQILEVKADPKFPKK
jgi:uncharacterized damage-inducible protein DinB